MSQAIQFNAVLSRVGTRSDGSLGLTLETPEFTAEECLAVFQLRNIPCRVTFLPNDADAAPPKEIRSELNRKTYSERIRAVIFCFYKHAGEPGSFDQFYAAECEKVINAYKAKLPAI